MKTPKPDPRELLRFAVLNHLGSIEVEDLRTEVISTRRGSGDLAGDFTVAAHDDLLKALRGPEDKSPVRLMLVIIPTEVSARMGSRIVLPGEAGR